MCGIKCSCSCGDVIIENVSDTGINVVACKNMEKVN
nr:DUF1667 domain-containing protein [Vagococcus hydrophili]